MEHGVELGKAVEQLRKELYALTQTVQGEELQFLVDSVEVELQVAVTKGGGTDVTAKFWVLEVAGKGTYEAQTTQTIKLTLKPLLKDKTGGKPPKIGRRKKG